ncbi:leptin receptor-like [Odontesthes bonariensis]|uniref:leptin receptor-like n=1 Tax=Odontesthes bonariensis TaxID=219752 RepID=UPI003F58CB39
MRDRTQGNSSARLLKQLKENHGEEWLDRLGHYFEECSNFVNRPSLFPVVCQEPPEPADVPTARWLLSVYGRDILSRIDHIKASLTSTLGTILKLDSTKKITKKLAGHSKGTALWVSSVGNELGQILNSVLTVQEGPGLDRMAAGLMERYRQAAVAPPKVLYVDCGCCITEGLSKLQARLGEWPDLHIRLDIWHFMRRLAVGCTTDAHPLYPAFMRALSSCIFEWDAGDLDLLRRSKTKQLQQEQRPGITRSMVDSHITKKELSTFCRRRTRGEESTLVQLERLLEELRGPKGRDLMGVPLLDEVRMDHIWRVQKRHIKCIQDVPGIPLYTEVGSRNKSGIKLTSYRCARGSTSLESFHCHLNRFIPVKPSPPVNLSNHQTHEGELIVSWDKPSDFLSGPLRYEVRYSSNTTHSTWQVVSTFGKPKLSLDLKPNLNYTIQVRCSGLAEPPMWSEWSKPHNILLNTVSYIPETAVALPGEYVTVYCVFNDHSSNASMAMWTLNLHQPLNHSQYYPVNQWVSKITVRAPETGIYDLLTCAPELTFPYPYSKIYVEGAFIDIKCTTSGDIDAMVCKWSNKERIKLKFQSKWAVMPCKEMKERERAGENVGVMGPPCMEVRSTQKTCTIQPLNLACYKLWLEMPSALGLITSKPLFLSPLDHVKPHTPTNVRALSKSSGVMTVTWKHPPLPVQGVQCEFRYCLSSNERDEWKVQSSVRDPWGEVVIPDICQEYMVQVRCKHISGKGYWSDWSKFVKSTPLNSKAPERGPDFWRIRQDDPDRRKSNVILLFEDFGVSGDSYCVDGFIILRQALNGSVMKIKTDLVSSYSFEWDQDFQTVTVEAFNSIGSSINNINMTLEKQPKRPCMHWFHVLAINSTCVSLSWSLLDSSSIPLFMVVQWSSQRQQGPEDPGLSEQKWVRLPYTDRPVYLQGDFYGYEDFVFYLYPVFADGEGEPMSTSATRRDPEAYIIPLFIFILCGVLFFSLVIMQKKMKKLVLKNVPNPKKCSWAEGLNFKKVDTFEHSFQPLKGLQALPLLLPSEKISKIIIVDKTQTEDLMESGRLLSKTPSIAINLDALITSTPNINEIQPVDPIVDLHQSGTDTSTQSSVTYSKVLLSDPKQDQQPIHLHYKDDSGGYSNDEGNLSANNLDISVSFSSGVRGPDSCYSVEIDKSRRSCSYNSAEDISETSEEEVKGDVKQEKDLYYPAMEYPAENEEGEEEEQSDHCAKSELLKNAVLNREDCSVESHLLVSPEGLSELSSELLLDSTCGLSPLYLPQYRTAPPTGILTAQT